MHIVIGGDFAPNDRVIKVIKKKDFESIFGDIVSTTQKADYAILNLEAPILPQGPVSQDVPKINLSTNESVVEALYYLGVDCVTLANNHLCDYGEIGIKSTIEQLQKNGIDYVGAGVNIVDAQKVLYKTVRGKTIGIISICEHEFSIASSDKAGAAPIDEIDNYYKILEAKKISDYVILLIHGGHEHYNLPSPRMKKLYHWFVDLGADVIVNHHQHCISGYEIYKEKPIFYGVGNFCFDWPGRREIDWNYGYLVELHIEDNQSFSITPYKQCSNECTITPLTGEALTTFMDKMETLNRIISSDQQLVDSYEKYCTSRSQNLKVTLSPYSNRYLLALCSRGFLPSFVNQNRFYRLLNYVSCESHRDVLIKYLEYMTGR